MFLGGDMGNLTALQVKRASPGRHGDGDGLYLVVSDTGSGKWVLRIQANKKRHDLGLGSAANVSLSEARDAAGDIRRAVRSGEDPLAKRRGAEKSLPTFREATVSVHNELTPTWKSAKHAREWLSSMETHVFPQIGDLSIGKVDGPMVREVLAKIWTKIPETASRVRQRIGIVLDFAHAKGWREAEAPMRSVSRGLARQPKNKQHLASMPWQEVSNFVSNIGDLLNSSESVRLAVEFAILTAARSGEVRCAVWSEINIETKTWLIPADRMKAGIAHRIPLSGRAIEILERMRSFRRTARPDVLVFEGQNHGQPFADSTLRKSVQRAGFPVTVHGFRSTFRVWCDEANQIPREVSEACLAHVVQNEVEAAYARSDHFDKRRVVMDSWAAYCTGTGESDNVVSLHQRA